MAVVMIVLSVTPAFAANIAEEADVFEEAEIHTEEPDKEIVTPSEEILKEAETPSEEILKEVETFSEEKADESREDDDLNKAIIYWSITDDYHMILSSKDTAESVLATGSFDAHEEFASESEVPWKDYRDSITEVEIQSDSEKGLRTNSTAFWFYGFSALEYVDMEKLNTRYTTSMKSMFENCTAIETLDISLFSVDSLERCNNMFAGCSKLKTIYMDSQNGSQTFSSAAAHSDGMFEECVSLVGSGRGYFSDTTYEDIYDDKEEKYITDYSFACVNGYYAEHGLFTESNETVKYDGLTVRFNHHDLILAEDEDTKTFDLTEYGAKSGTITISRDDDGIKRDIVISNICIDSYTPDEDEEVKGVLYVTSLIGGEYHIVFDGKIDMSAKDNSVKDFGEDAMFFLFSHGSDVTVDGINDDEIVVQGFNFQEHRGKTKDAPVQYSFNDVNISSNTYDSYAVNIYGTQMIFNNCDFECQNFKDDLCFILGVGSELHEDDLYTVEFNNCNISAVNNDDTIGSIELGYPSPSAFNCSHSKVAFNDCDVFLSTPYAPMGECRGVFMLHGGLTINGGTFKSFCGTEAGFDPDKPDVLICSAAIQAVYVTIINADVELGAYSNDIEHAVADTWGIIYAQNVLVENSSLNIDVKGTRTQGIYYFGRSSSDKDIITDKNSDEREEYHEYGDVVLNNSDVKINSVSYDSQEYVNSGISARHIYFDLPRGSKKKMNINVSEPNGKANALTAFNFEDDGSIRFDNAACIESPKEYYIKELVYKPYYGSSKFYTIVDCESGTVEGGNVVKSIVVGTGNVKPVPHSGESSGAVSTVAGKAAFTGTRGNPVTGGTWTLKNDGNWYFNCNGQFIDTWGYIVNPYAGGIPQWFYFDKSGIMLYGWQKINDKWYLLNPVHDGSFGACILGPGITYDGYIIDENGAWIE